MWNNILAELRRLPPVLFNLSLTVFAVIVGLIIKAISTLLLRYYSSKNLAYSFIGSFFKRLNGALTIFLPLLVLNLLLPLMTVGPTLYNIIDCSDGQLARLKKNGTHTGRIIDGSADYITAAFVFIGLGIGFPDQRYE